MDITISNIDFNNFDAIIIPGAGGPRNGLDPIGSLPEWISKKLTVFHQKYCANVNEKNGVPVILLSAGTFHKPGSLDCNGRNFQESTGMALYLEHLGFPTSLLYEENASYDTVGNAYFCRTIHTDVRGWNRLLVIVNEFHYPRLKLIFDWVFGLMGANSSGYHIEYLYYPDNLLENREIVEGRLSRERKSYDEMEGRIQELKIDNLVDFHQWMFSQHNIYRANNKKNLVLRKIETVIDNQKCMESY